MRYLYLLIVLFLCGLSSIMASVDSVDEKTVQQSYSESEKPDSIQNDSLSNAIKDLNLFFFHLQQTIQVKEMQLRQQKRLIYSLIFTLIVLMAINAYWLASRRKPGKFPVITMQKNQLSGLVAILAFLRYYGKKYTYRKLLKLIESSANTPESVNLDELYNLMQNLDFNTKALRMEFNELQQISKIPVIVYFPNHFAVVYKIDQKFVYLVDPFYGKMQLAHYYFVTSWYSADRTNKGVLLMAYPTYLDKDPKYTEIKLRFDNFKEIAPNTRKNFLCELPDSQSS